jgi:hypothetical protein
MFLPILVDVGRVRVKATSVFEHRCSYLYMLNIYVLGLCVNALPEPDGSHFFSRSKC